MLDFVLRHMLQKVCIIRPAVVLSGTSMILSRTLFVEKSLIKRILQSKSPPDKETNLVYLFTV